MGNVNYEMLRQQNQMAKAMWEDQRELARVKAKAEIQSGARLDYQIKKSRLREMEEERKKATYEELTITPEGEVQLMTKNLSIAAKPRSVVNANDFSLVVLKRMRNPSEIIYVVGCQIGGKKRQIFLDYENAGRGIYLVKKFGAAGVNFMASSAEAKRLAMQLLAILLQNCSAQMDLPDRPGWVKKSDGKFCYFREEDLNWTEAKRLCR